MKAKVCLLVNTKTKVKRQVFNKDLKDLNSLLLSELVRTNCGQLRRIHTPVPAATSARSQCGCMGFTRQGVMENHAGTSKNFMGLMIIREDWLTTKCLLHFGNNNWLKNYRCAVLNGTNQSYKLQTKTIRKLYREIALSLVIMCKSKNTLNKTSSGLKKMLFSSCSRERYSGRQTDTCCQEEGQACILNYLESHFGTHSQPASRN